mmetsp:Transcript_49157/g.122888  ORF Transcript_49157/g.122888 Transcript_49157/m.122888 type:complete len:223 (+) Transcript_49157:280-948(+)
MLPLESAEGPVGCCICHCMGPASSSLPSSVAQSAERPTSFISAKRLDLASSTERTLFVCRDVLTCCRTASDTFMFATHPARSIANSGSRRTWATSGALCIMWASSSPAFSGGTPKLPISASRVTYLQEVSEVMLFCSKTLMKLLRPMAESISEKEGSNDTPFSPGTDDRPASAPLSPPFALLFFFFDLEDPPLLPAFILWASSSSSRVTNFSSSSLSLASSC